MPLVLHGGTGIPTDMIKKAIDLGVSKINVNTECQLSFAEATRKYIEEGKDQQGKGYDPRSFLHLASMQSRLLLKRKWNLRIRWKSLNMIFLRTCGKRKGTAQAVLFCIYEMFHRLFFPIGSGL